MDAITHSAAVCPALDLLARLAGETHSARAELLAAERRLGGESPADREQLAEYRDRLAAFEALVAGTGLAGEARVEGTRLA